MTRVKKTVVVSKIDKPDKPKKAKKESASSRLEQAVLIIYERNEWPKPRQEYIFHPTRKWRIDFAHPEVKLAIEVEGGTWGQPIRCQNCGVLVRRGRAIVRAAGRHNSAAGMTKDAEKYNAMAIGGWTLIRVTSEMVRNGAAEADIRDALKEKGLIGG